MVRGISNSSGTACHISSVLIILAFCCEPLVDVLSRSNKPFLRQLGWMLQTLRANGVESAVDPTKFYADLKKKIHVEPQELGDAVTALLKLLQAIREQGGEDIAELLEATVDGGRVHSVIDGTCDFIYEGRTVSCRRKKQLKQRTMECPFSLSCLDTPADSDLTSEIVRTLTAKKLNGYQWSGEYEQEGMVECMRDDNPGLWRTTKVLCIDALPNIWMIHLERFKWTDQKLRSSDKCIKVPLHLQTEDIQWRQEAFELKGGILHVGDHGVELGTPEQEDEPNGHYVAIVWKGDSWYLVDDDEVQTVSADAAVDLFSGNDCGISKERYCQGTLLVYERVGSMPYMQATADTMLSKMTLNESEDANMSPPEAMIGRRLKILWARGKFYSGMITSYSIESGKHTVLYDDGDVRQYNLKKKTIEWLD